MYKNPLPKKIRLVSMVDASMLKKARIVATIKDDSLTDIVNIALKDYVEKSNVDFTQILSK